MKNTNFSFLIIAMFFIIAILMLSCAVILPDVEEDWMGGTSTQRTGTNTPSAPRPSTPLTIEGNEWKLIKVYIDSQDTLFDRNALPPEAVTFLTLRIDTQLISGVGVPNRYSAPYSGSNQTLNIMPMMSTMMASFYQPENITEHEYFIYLQNTTSWRLVDNMLELLSKTENDRSVRLVFSL